MATNSYRVWVDDCGWFPSGEMPIDGSGVSYGEALHIAHELVKEYKASAIMILPACLKIVDRDAEFGIYGGTYEVVHEAESEVAE